jgi:hypothetical protein
MCTILPYHEIHSTPTIDYYLLANIRRHRCGKINEHSYAIVD